MLHVAAVESSRLTSNLCKGTEEIFEDDQEDQQERNHEGEEQSADRLSEDKTALLPVVLVFQTHGRLIEYRDDELLGGDSKQEYDAANR